MTKPYYQTPSPIGAKILSTLEILEYEYKEDCIHTIWHLESDRKWNFNLLNAVKYLWRAGQKDPDPRQDLTKAVEYLEWEKTRLENVLAHEKSYIYTRIGNDLKLKLQLAIDVCNFTIEEYTKDKEVGLKLEEDEKRYGKYI